MIVARGNESSLSFSRGDDRSLSPSFSLAECQPGGVRLDLSDRARHHRAMRDSHPRHSRAAISDSSIIADRIACIPNHSLPSLGRLRTLVAVKLSRSYTDALAERRTSKATLRLARLRLGLVEGLRSRPVELAPARRRRSLGDDAQSSDSLAEARRPFKPGAIATETRGTLTR